MPIFKLGRVIKLFAYRNYINYKFLAIILFYLVYLYTIVEPLLVVSSEINYSLNFGLIALTLSDVRVKLVLYVGIAIIFSNLPFKDSIQIPIVQRLGKRVWYGAQVFYVMVTSVIINAIFVLAFYSLLVPNISFENGWGTVIRSLARQDPQIMQYIEVPTIDIQELVIRNYSPDQAVFLTISISILVTIIIGLIIILGNRLVRHGGIIITYLFIFINLFVPRALGRYVYFFSPLTWISLSHTATSEQSYFPRHTYIYIVSVSLIIILSALIIFMTTNKTEIEIER